MPVHPYGRWRAIATFLVAALLGVASATPAVAQYYTDNPCAPPRPGFAGFIDSLTAAQRAQACQQARDAEMRREQADYAASQARQAEEQRAAAERQAEEQRAAAERQAEDERAASEWAASVAAARAAAESSPDNLCRKPEFANVLITQYNEMMPNGYEVGQVVDIEHLVTIRSDSERSLLVCHGVWLHTHGMRIEGTMTLRPNVAGNMIATWEMGHWDPPVTIQPTSPARVGTQSTQSGSASLSSQASAPASPTASGPEFQQGLADRTAWENWFAATTGDYRNGALYWSSQRSLAHPGSCEALGGDASAGCAAAKSRLVASDALRKREPDYRSGWNSYPAQ